MTANYFDQLESELRAAVPRATKRRARLGWAPPRPPRVGVLLSVVGVGVTVAVVVVFASLAGHRRTTTHPPALRHSFPSARQVPPAPLGSVPTLQQLLENFAILRGSGGGDPFSPGQKNLTRVARVFPGGYRVYVYVRRFSGARTPNLATEAYALNFGIEDSHGNGSATSFGPDVNYAVDPISWGAPPGLRSGHPGEKTLWASLVPDGVATVTWTFACRPAPHTNPRICAGFRAQTVTMRVVNNVAASDVAGLGRGAMPEVTWRSADGRVLGPSFGGYGNFAAAPFVKGEREGHELRVLLPSGIDGAKFGQPSSSAIETIMRLLGPPAQVDVRTGSCGIDHETVWASPTTANLLTIFQRAGRFVGYQYGVSVERIGLIQGPGAVLATANGLTLNDTVADGRQLYGSAFTTTTTNGGTSQATANWQVTSNSGRLSGNVLPTTYPVRGITPSDRIANIAAGEIGCPASANSAP
jgi:hypothetical protein